MLNHSVNHARPDQRVSGPRWLHWLGSTCFVPPMTHPLQVQGIDEPSGVIDTGDFVRFFTWLSLRRTRDEGVSRPHLQDPVWARFWATPVPITPSAADSYSLEFHSFFPPRR